MLGCIPLTPMFAGDLGSASTQVLVRERLKPRLSLGALLPAPRTAPRLVGAWPHEPADRSGAWLRCRATRALRAWCRPRPAWCGSNSNCQALGNRGTTSPNQLLPSSVDAVAFVFEHLQEGLGARRHG